MKFVTINNSGSALLISLALILMLSGVAMMATDRATTDIDLSYNQIHNEQAFYIAEAGLIRAEKELDDSTRWRNGYNNESFGGGTFTVTIRDSSIVAGLDDTMIILSTGDIVNAQVTLEALAVPRYLYPFDYAAFGDSAMVFDQGSCSDSYNSDSGTYAATQDTLGGDIGSNGTVTLEGGSTIGGDASTTEDGGFDISGGSTITGDTTGYMPTQTLPDIPPEEFVYAEANSLAPTGFTGTYSYDPVTHDLVVGRDDTLVLASGVYYLNNITLEQYSSIQLAPGADVKIYATGDIDAGRYSSMNPDGSPISFQIYSSGSEFELARDSEFRGIFYGPDAAVTITQNDLIYGSLVGASIGMHRSTCIHYDRSLAGGFRLELGPVDIVAWREM
ncbi:MAG: hypothetical protein IIB00_10455 [candidate division Zixibacteria bacterium]|nr:hypothetical protein [candidate division Zixibacteria bacterium]